MPFFGIVPIFLEIPYIKIHYESNGINSEFMDGLFNDFSRYEHILIPDHINPLFANVKKENNILIVIEDESKKQTKLKEALHNVREKRNKLLKDTDYFMISDYPVDETHRNRIKQYRQQLRDITKTTDPFNPIFPELPLKT